MSSWTWTEKKVIQNFVRHRKEFEFYFNFGSKSLERIELKSDMDAEQRLAFMLD